MIFAAAALAAQVALAPCTIEGVPGEAQCGTYKVWENRDARQGRQIDLSIIVLSALEPNKKADPFFMLQGGPGDAPSFNARFYSRAFHDIRKTRDIVLVDLRGTGKSATSPPRSGASWMYELSMVPWWKSATMERSTATPMVVSSLAERRDGAPRWRGLDRLHARGLGRIFGGYLRGVTRGLPVLPRCLDLVQLGAEIVHLLLDGVAHVACRIGYRRADLLQRLLGLRDQFIDSISHSSSSV